MPADRTEAGIRTASEHRLALIDPLLPAQSPPGHAFSGPSATANSCEARFAATDATGALTALGRCEHWDADFESLDAVWGAARRFTLIPEIAGQDVAGALDQLIGQWRDHLTAVPEAGDEDTAAIINWPSRDVVGLPVLRKHGLTARDVVAARPFARRSADFAGRPRPGEARRSRVRRADNADLDPIAQFGLAEIRYDAHFGGVIERPGAGAAIRQYLADLLAEPDPWVWVAEAEDLLLGLLAAERPHTAEWIAPLTSRSPVAYVTTAFVPPSVRGTGVGGELAQAFHDEADAAAVRATLLHYELLNPRSGPFWNQHGYRPLWTGFEATPARPAHHLR
jgi:GNAT superfamily N-acetyltransferase